MKIPRPKWWADAAVGKTAVSSSLEEANPSLRESWRRPYARNAQSRR
jgi:hypothetical protein